MDFSMYKNQSMSEHDIRYIRESANHTLLTKEEELLCARVIQRYGDKSSKRAAALEKLIIHNQKLVIKSAYTYHHLAPSIPVMDFFGAGNQGLAVAASKYNPDEFQTRFSTYATPHILCPIRKMISRACYVKVPEYLRQMQSQYYRLIESGDFDDTTIMKRLDIDETTLAKIRGAEVYAVYIDAQDEDGNSLSDIISYENDVLPDQIADIANLNSFLKDAINELSDREQYVINNRLLADKTMTLEEVSEVFNITRERVRQIQREALKKLKWILKKKGITGYVGTTNS